MFEWLLCENVNGWNIQTHTIILQSVHFVNQQCLAWSFDKMNINQSHYLIVCPLIKPVIHCYSDLICPGKGAEIDCIDCKGLSPLLMASNCGAWKTIAFLLSIGKTFSWIFNTFFLQYYLRARFCMFKIFSYWKKGADFKIKDKAGRNFLHFVILQPKGLKNLPETVLQVWKSS